MPGDPQKCRERALKCKYLANDAPTQPTKQMFLDLAQSWFRPAPKIEDTNTFLKALNEMEFEQDVLDKSFSEEVVQHKAA